MFDSSDYSTCKFCFHDEVRQLQPDASSRPRKPTEICSECHSYKDRKVNIWINFYVRTVNHAYSFYGSQQCNIYIYIYIYIAYFNYIYVIITLTWFDTFVSFTESSKIDHCLSYVCSYYIIKISIIIIKLKYLLVVGDKM